MPRYTLGDADMKALTAYLRQLSVQPSSGVSTERMAFATVIAPGQDPVRRQAVIDVLRTVQYSRRKSAYRSSRTQTQIPVNYGGSCIGDS